MAEGWCHSLDAVIDKRFGELVSLRRHLHKHPEVSGAEEQTSLYLYQLLDSFGFQVRMGPDGRGVVADSQAHRACSAGPIFALRADIDALRIQDSKQVDYRSQNDGVMHACGHDAHTAVVFGALMGIRALQETGEIPSELRYRGIFQPAEETCEGAQQMIKVGVLDGVSEILAVHVDPSRELGTVGLRAGALTANCDEMQLRISGHGGHAARPHETRDPIAAAAQLINTLYLQIPRVTDSQDAVVVSIGQILGGENANVIPESVLLRGTLRSLDRHVRQQTKEHISRLATSIGELTQTTIDVHFGLGANSVNNDAGIVNCLEGVVREILGDLGIDWIAKASMGSEDFAFYLDHVPGAMLRLGCRSDTRGGAALHTSVFDVDESALAIGAKVLARTLVYRAAEHHDQI